MTGRTRRACLRHNSDGATLVEFAFVAPVLFLILMGFFDLTHKAYAKAVLTGTVQKAARDATLESGPAAAARLDAKVAAGVRMVTGGRATVRTTRSSYTDFRGVGTPEQFTDAKAPLNNRYDAGECFVDTNGNGRWDADIGRDGQGGAEDAVLYTVTVEYPRLFPMTGMMGWTPTQEIVSSTVLRNQPYADQVVPVVEGC